jgi:class 3 adenylate cyclase/predicted ATPase
MQQIANWLEKLGMSEYAQHFAEHGITIAALPYLTDQDLKDIGVLLGHRRLMLAAISEVTAAAKPEPSVASEQKSPGTAERRQVTVMFSDLVGSTALSARMDPEDLREVISAYQNCVAKTVRRFNGFVAKYMGDGVLVYFGYPRAHEDDAEQAVRAGLELVSAVTALKTSVSLQSRVGIATGLVVVGDLIGSGEAQERGIIGETPNLAARLQGIAEPNMVVLADSTRRLLGDLFELKELGTQDLKGIVGPARAWAALRQSTVESRFEAMHETGLTTLVGRDEECELLLRRWSKAKAGEGQVVLLSGEAGIGKSRLTAALLERLAGEPHTRLRYFCSPQHADSALYPIIGQLERAAGFRHNDEPHAKRDKLDALLKQTSTSGHDIALFVDMLSLPNDGRYPALGMTPQQRRQKTLQALVFQMEALTQRSPVLMIFEDAHWTDPTSLELLDLVVERIQTLSVLLIVTFRPEFEPPWIGRSHVTSLAINRLAQREIVSLIDRVVGERTLPDSIRQDIIERADGVPLFVEEMTKAVLEAESEGEARRTAAAVPSSVLAVPASLHASLMARLDRLGTAKEVAQMGAAIGREFSHALLAVVIRKPDAELGSALDRLIAAGLLFRQGVPPHATYLFKHALVQDAAYGTLLREPRRALHARIADALEEQFGEIAASQPQLLAHHCTEAGLIEKAAALWGDAGQRSLARSALLEGKAQLARALDQIATMPTTPKLRREQIKFQVTLANAMMHTKGYAASETKASLDRARVFIERAEALGEPPEDPLLLFSVRYGFWVANYVAFDGDTCFELAEEFLALAEKQRATVPMMIGHRLMGSSLLFTGQIAEARLHYDQAIALYNPAEHRPLAMRFGQDVEVACLSFRALVLWLLGYPEAALADTDRALRNASAIGQATTLMFALSHVPFTRIQCGDYAVGNAQADEGLALANEKGAVLWKSQGTKHKGLVFALTGSAAEAVQMITSALDTARWAGSTLWVPSDLPYLAIAHAQRHCFEDAWHCISDAMSAAKTRKLKWCQAEIYRIAGEIALMSSERDTARAEANFERALAVARAQQAKSWELRAATSMARLWREQGKRNQARELLAPVYGWFTEGFDTLDLKQAKALLDELAA